MNRVVWKYLSYLTGLVAAVQLQAAPFPTNCCVPASIGVNIHFTDPQPGEMDMLASAGFKWVRMDFDWSGIEKKKGEYDFSAYDHLLNLCEQHHLRLMAIFDYASPFYDNNESPHSDAGITGFTNWVVASVGHFKGHHILWEMYNEPNGFWRPHPDVNAYAKLAVAVGRAIKSNFPNELHCGPGLSGTGADWLEPCYKAGLLEYWDAVSVHPYGDEPPEAREVHYKGVRALIERYRPRDRNIPLLSGEWGYTASRVSRETQGKYFAREILFNLYSGLPLSIWYDWRDDGLDPKNGEHNFGLVANQYHKGGTPVLAPKPGYLASRTLNAQLSGFCFSKRLPLADTNDFALVFNKGAETRIAAWTTSSKPHQVKLELPRGSFSVTGWTGEQLPAISSRGGDVELELLDAPKYLVPHL